MDSDPIEHVVLLLLENHSFDQMLGSLSEVIPQLDGIDRSNLHVNNDIDGRSYIQTPSVERQMLDDPHHEVSHVATQIADGNSGFVKDFSQAFKDSTPAARAPSTAMMPPAGRVSRIVYAFEGATCTGTPAKSELVA